MNYQNGWVWSEDSTEEQRAARGAEAALNRLSQEAANLYNEIPEARSSRDWDDENAGAAEDAQWESIQDAIDSEYGQDLTSEQLREVQERAWDAAKQDRSDSKADQFAQLEAIEELLSIRGARFKRAYEDWNEDEKFMEYSERDREDER